MTVAGSRPIAPSSRLALYLGALIAVYVIRDPVPAILFGVAAMGAALVIVSRSPRPVPRGRWRAAAVFIVWVFVMRAALDLVAGVSPHESTAWLAAGRQAVRVGVLAIGVIALIAATTAREVVDELEHSGLPRSLRLLVMMLVQYPRVLRDRYDQIVEAQVARGADRPRSVVQRVAHGGALLLPVMQSELNAVGERAALIHLRGLDVEVPATSESLRTSRDFMALAIAIALVAGALALRFGR
jgi:energy-coupling factor transporter transmembrane protein EcfT